ncbi:MAG: undecaprenyl-diphosphate phosphatase [Clostridia bacterium]|nr:undecaprenyl-diphosphate phosphatase [Clostridia bacterium]
MEFVEIIKIILLGIIEGLTEWLPVSSTGHLLLFDAFIPLNASADFKELFTVVIQLGAILAVVILFFKKLFPLERQKNEETGEMKTVANKQTLTLWLKILVACLPAAVIGLLLDDFLEEHLYTPLVISITLILYGVAFILVENSKKNKPFLVETVHEITYKQALVIGAFQVLSLIPGTSRSGATILGALLIGISRPAGAEFTFFLAIPVMVGASGLKLVKYLLAGNAFTGAEIGYLAIGTIVAFAVSLFAVKLLMNFVKKHDFKVFGFYRIILGAAVIGALVLPPLFA